MIYQIYFVIFMITLLISYLIVKLYQKGYRVKYENKHFRIENIGRSISNASKKLIGSKINSRLSNKAISNTVYDSLKKDYPDVDIEELKETVKSYLIRYLRNDSTDNIKKSADFIDEGNSLYDDNEIDKDSILILRVIMNKYAKEKNLSKISFNATLEYNRNYENGVPRTIQENYIAEFVRIYSNLKKDKKIKCQNCGKEFLMINKNTKCPHCNEAYDDIWYLNKIKKI